MTQEQIKELAQAYFVEKWSKSREFALLVPTDEQYDPIAETEWLKHDEQRLRSLASQGKFNSVVFDAKELVANLAPGQPVSGDDLAQLYGALLRAQIEDRRILAALLSGKYDESEPIDPLFKGMSEPPLPPLKGEKSIGTGSSLAEIAKKFCEQKSTTEWVVKTYNENRRVLDWFIEWVGGQKPIKSVSLEDVRDFRDAIQKLPANFTKAKKYAGQSIKQIVASIDGETPLAPKTQQKYFFNLKGFLSWCVDEGYLTTHPAAQLKIAVKINEKEARFPFSSDQLITLFNSPQYRGHLSHANRSMPGAMVVRDGKFWIPLVGLFSGMRLGEIVQLLVTDIRQDGVTDYFNVARGEGEDKQLKTASSMRVVPIHPQLIKLGFLELVETRRKQSPKGRIFEDVKPGADGYYSHNFSKYFSGYLKQIGTKTAKTSFHSFRHNFTDALRTAHVQDSRTKALLGHADNSVTAGYGSKYTAADLASDLASVDYGISFDALMSSK
jgi:integrase